MLQPILNFLRTLGGAALFMRDIVKCIFTGQIRWNELLKQVHDQGIQTVVIVFLTSFASGAVLAMQGQVMMERFGAKEFIAQLVALSLVRELSPVFTALVFSGKAGAGVASELGTMSVNNQIMATRTLGVDPIEFLIVPRFLACMLVLPILVVFSEVVGILGGYLIAISQANIPPAYYIHQTFSALGYPDFYSGFIKIFFFAALIGWICCYQGFTTSGGSMGVGRFTTKAVALCYIAVIVSNTFLTKLVLSIWSQ